MITVDLNAFIELHKQFLKECEQKGWNVEVLIEEFGNHLTLLTNTEEIEVQFFIEVDLDKTKTLNNKKQQSMLDYGVIREEGKDEGFAKEVLDAFHSYMTEQLPSRKYIYFTPKKRE